MRIIIETDGATVTTRPSVSGVASSQGPFEQATTVSAGLAAGRDGAAQTSSATRAVNAGPAPGAAGGGTVSVAQAGQTVEAGPAPQPPSKERVG